MENRIINSDFVIVVCTESYWKKIRDTDAKGVTWEVNMVYQILYDEYCQTTKFIPVILKDTDDRYILTPIKPYTHYNIETDDGYEGLLRHLLNIPKYQKPELGDVKIKKYEPMPEKKQNTMFYSTPINIKKWNAAGWKGMVYILSPDSSAPPILGFLYRNYEAAKQIFVEWKKNYKGVSVDDYLKITYIIPPLPKNCYVNSDPEKNYGKGYFVYLGVNEEKVIERAITGGYPLENLLIATISRYIWVDEYNGIRNRELFFQQLKKFGRYTIIPIGIIDENKPFSDNNIISEYGYEIEMKNAYCKRGIDIGENDSCKSVLTRERRED